jgi:lipid-A-disaccharide synthase
MKVLIIAAETSSAIYAEKLLEEFKRTPGEPVESFGVGTLKMEQMGFKRLGAAEEMAVFGFAEVISKYSELKLVFNSVVEACRDSKPDVALLLDYPGFNLKLAKELAELNIPVLYYISPQVWAWKKGRIKHIKKYVSKMLVILPFEVPFYQSAGVPVEFVGHPLLETLDAKYFDSKYFSSHRGRLGISDSDIVLALMPGSRRSELKYNFLTQLAVAREVYTEVKNIKIAIFVAPNFQKDDLLPYLENVRYPYILLKDEPNEMIHMSDIVLATSGTATLVVGLLGKPMVIMYKVHWLTALIVKLIVHGVKFFGLVNLIKGYELVPERFQGRASVQELKKLVLRYVKDEAYRRNVEKELVDIRNQLGSIGATARVAEIVRSYSK